MSIGFSRKIRLFTENGQTMSHRRAKGGLYRRGKVIFWISFLDSDKIEISPGAQENYSIIILTEITPACKDG